MPPLEMKIVTVWCLPRRVPAPGFCANTIPCGRSLWPTRGATSRPRSWIRTEAACSVSPITFGTVVLSLPRVRRNQASRPPTTTSSRSTSQSHQYRSGGGPTGSATSSSTAVAEGRSRRTISSIRRRRPRRPRARSIQFSHSACRSAGSAAKRSRASGRRSNAAATSAGRSLRLAIRVCCPVARFCNAAH